MEMTTEQIALVLILNIGFCLLIIIPDLYKNHIKKIKVNPTKYSYIKYCYLYADDYSDKKAKKGDKKELLEYVKNINIYKSNHHLFEILCLLKGNKYELEESEIKLIEKELEAYMGISLQSAYRIMEVLALANKYQKTKK